MKNHLMYMCFFVLFFSGCLLTHQDIQRESLVSKESAEEDDEDIVAVRGENPKPVVAKAKQAEQNQPTHSGVSSADNAEIKSVSSLKKTSIKSGSSHSMAEQVSEMATSLRELRGEITRSNKEKEEQLQSFNQGLISLIQALDLRVTALAEEVKKLKNQSTPVKKQKDEDIFQKAEKLFKEKNWKSAIIHYEKYRAQNKAGKFYKEATFQIGLCFQKLGMHKEAKVFFRELLESFPKSELAKKAKKLLSASPTAPSAVATTASPTDKSN